MGWTVRRRLARQRLDCGALSPLSVAGRLIGVAHGISFPRAQCRAGVSPARERASASGETSLPSASPQGQAGSLLYVEPGPVHGTRDVSVQLNRMRKIFLILTVVVALLSAWDPALAAANDNFADRLVVTETNVTVMVPTPAHPKNRVNLTTRAIRAANHSGGVGRRRRTARSISIPTEAILIRCWRFIRARAFPG